MAEKKNLTFDEANVQAMVEMISNFDTPEHSRVQILNKLIEADSAEDFFDVIMKEKLDVGKCPTCDHENHWAIPELELNQRGIVTSKLDDRVKAFTTEEDCEVFQQACPKKKLTF